MSAASASLKSPASISKAPSRPTRRPACWRPFSQADLVVFCPSNPWVSIDPILAVPGLRAAIQSRPALAVSPIIGGQTVKGPAAKMFAEMGIEPGALAVARHYGKMLKGFVLDQVDALQAQEIRALEIRDLSDRYFDAYNSGSRPFGEGGGGIRLIHSLVPTIITKEKSPKRASREPMEDVFDRITCSHYQVAQN